MACGLPVHLDPGPSPIRAAKGIELVMVNGDVVWRDGRSTGARPGAAAASRYVTQLKPVCATLVPQAARAHPGAELHDAGDRDRAQRRVAEKRTAAPEPPRR